MNRKKWTPKTEVTQPLLKFREKRKWQIALRRYVLEKNRRTSYAPYFGIDSENFRKWIELQFDGELHWENFSQKWQFGHIVPVTYFNFSDENELKLCWNFINIRVEKFDLNKNRGNRVDMLAAKRYFEILYEKTNYSLSFKMIEKINQIEISQIAGTAGLEAFINENKDYLEIISDFSSYEFDQLNNGKNISQILEVREFLKKFN